MTWPRFLWCTIRIVDPDLTDESQLSGMFDTLIHHLFPLEMGYYMTFRHKAAVYPESVDSSLIYIAMKLTDKPHPVCFLETAPRGHLRGCGTRAFADEQMRRTFERLIPDLISPKLFGLHFMGTRFAVYEYDRSTNKVSPEYIPRYIGLSSDYAPVSRWEYELLEPAGEAKLKEVANTIQAMTGGKKSIF